MSYFAEVRSDTNRVVRVILADSIEWCQQNQPNETQIDTTQVDNGEGGFVDVPVFTSTFWLETADPYLPAGTVVYCGPGYHHDPGVVERFVGDVWDVDKATTPDAETGLYRYRTFGELTWHNGKAWRNLMPDNSPNVWEPPTNWREYPMGIDHPLWIQPSGAIDAYPLDFVVEHNGVTYKSLNAANVWEPGTDPLLWEDLTPAPAVLDWVQPTGAQDAYPLGAIVTHNGQTWENTGSAANVWEPGVFGWIVV